MTLLGIANRWFDRKSFGDDVTLLWEPHVHPLLRCNIWHVRGRDRDLLIDTGMGIASLAGAAKDLFEKDLTVVLTHTHLDHMGGAHEFGGVCLHPAEEQELRNPSNLIPIDMKAWGEEALAEIARMGYDISGGILTAIPHKDFDPAAFETPSARIQRRLGEGDTIDLGDRALEILHLPGHSPGSIGLWEKATGTLFSGDAIYDGPLLDESPEADIPTYVKTMERIRKLPVRIVHGGHDPSFGRERMIEIADAYLARRDRNVC